MRIVCENCHTKYIVPDEKIVKSVLRLTCQKCGHVITARVDENAPQDAGTLGKWHAAGGSNPPRTQDDRPQWYYSYNGESVGPFTESELIQKFHSEKLAPVAKSCYVWKKTFKEWKPAVEVEPFSTEILRPPAPPVPPPAPATPDAQLPPLFNKVSESSQEQSAVARSSSPDIKGLKIRLQESDNHLVSSAVTTTASPLVSFQSLDSISHSIQSDTGQVLNKIVPSVSNLAAISKPESPQKEEASVSSVPSVSENKSEVKASVSSTPTVSETKSEDKAKSIADLIVETKSEEIPANQVTESKPAEAEIQQDKQVTSSPIVSSLTESDKRVGSIENSDDLPEIDLAESGAYVAASRTGVPSTESGIQSAEPEIDDIDLDEDAPKSDSSSDRHDSFDEIRARHSDLFAALNIAEAGEEMDESLSEKSMLLQIEHFNQVQTKSKNKSWGIALAILAAIILLAVGGYIFGSKLNEEPTFQEEDTTYKLAKNDSFGHVQGRSVSSEELDDSLIPKDDFEFIVEPSAAPAEKQPENQAKKSSSSSRSRSKSDNSDKAPADKDKVTEVADALYGLDSSSKTAQPLEIPSVKKDGRANVILDRKEFASTDGVKGTKYQIGGANTQQQMFAIGLKSISKSVQECYAREAKNASMRDISKIYISLTVEPSGKVEKFNVEEKTATDSFKKCLEAKKTRWNFAPFEGNAVQFRQGFVLGD